MQVRVFTDGIRKLGIQTVAGVPDSTLKTFCEYLNFGNEEQFRHYVPANEGAAVGLAIGTYLSTGKPACVYMQNSGLGNIVNPLTSLANKEVYGIPMLFLIGFRGEPGEHDEPQHKFMGRITESLLDCLEVSYGIVDKHTTEEQLEVLWKEADSCLKENKQYALIVKKDTFGKEKFIKYDNGYELSREKAIATLLNDISQEDIIVSTTGKISREVYEQCDNLGRSHNQAFLTVGGMGHASMIALELAESQKEKRVICIDGDGAVLMHMGSLALIAKRSPQNLIHILLNNDVHESVGGMPTGAHGLQYQKIADSCGYRESYGIRTEEELEHLGRIMKDLRGPAFVEILVQNASREDLLRPVETARENLEQFVKYHEIVRR